MRKSTEKKDRIDVRISKEQKEFFRYASELRGFKSLSEFVIHCVFMESNKIVKDNNLIVNTLEDKERFIEAVLNPPSPNAELRRAVFINGVAFPETPLEDLGKDFIKEFEDRCNKLGESIDRKMIDEIELKIKI